MIILSQTANGNISPIGIILMVVFFAIIVLAFVSMGADKKAHAKFAKEFLEKTPIIDSFAGAYITEQGELLINIGVGFKKWKLQDIGYISTHQGKFSVLGHNKKTLEAEDITLPKYRRAPGAGLVNFQIGWDNMDSFAQFVKKHGAHIQHMQSGKIKG